MAVDEKRIEFLKAMNYRPEKDLKPDKGHPALWTLFHGDRQIVREETEEACWELAHALELIRRYGWYVSTKHPHPDSLNLHEELILFAGEAREMLKARLRDMEYTHKQMFLEPENRDHPHAVRQDLEYLSKWVAAIGHLTEATIVTERIGYIKNPKEDFTL